MTALAQVLALLPDVATAHPDDVEAAVRKVGPIAVSRALLSYVSPSGTLTAIAEAPASNDELERELDHFDADERAVADLEKPSLATRLEDDFALAAPAIADAFVPLENWAIPLLSALAGPCAPLLSFALLLACKIALLALTRWAAKRTAARAARPSSGA